MTDREVMQMALVQMGINQRFVAASAKHINDMAFNGAMEVLRTRLEQPEQIVPSVYSEYTPPQRKPLTTEELSSIVNEALRGHASTRDAIDWAIRHVERHHGIQPDPAADAMRDFFRTGVGVIPAD